MSKIKVPKKISPDPIINSVIEFRFQSSLKKEAAVPAFFNTFRNDFPTFYDDNQFFNQPMQQPEYTTRVNIQNDQFSVGFGTNVIVFGNAKQYMGWQAFSKMVFQNLELLSKQKLIGKIDRIGIRYVNFFKDLLLISDKTNLQLVSPDSDDKFVIRNTQLKTALEKGKIGFNITIADSVIHGNNTGSILDIDTFIEKVEAQSHGELIALIEKAHEEEKLLFYSILKSDFIKTLNPEY